MKISVRTILIIFSVFLLAGCCYAFWWWGQDKGYDAGYDSGYIIGNNEGFEKGWEIGYNDGHEIGYQKAVEATYSKAQTDLLRTISDTCKENGVRSYPDYPDLLFMSGETYADNYKQGYVASQKHIWEMAESSWITSRRVHYQTIDNGRIVVVTIDVFTELLDRLGFEPY